jgi:dTDP-4-dehydrorhamnose 3,5-epimerase
MRFTATPLAIPGVLLIAPPRFEDERGTFMESYRANDFAELGVRTQFVQENLASSASTGTIRGLHFQKPPFAQAKLVRVSRGAVLDVVLDLRTGSPTFGRALGVRLQANGKQLFVPKGCAHGYCTLEPDTEIAYKCDAYYAAAAEGGVNAADPALGIDWPVSSADAVMSDKDRALPPLNAFTSPFALEMT